MKILVFSDSHGVTDKMETALAEHRGETDAVIHLGDGAGDLKRCAVPEGIPVITVSGNYEDFFSAFMPNDHPPERIVEFGGVRILCTHGHRYGVKSSVERAAAHAGSSGAALLLFGHTHRPLDVSETLPSGEILRIFNPGTAGNGYPSSYGIVEIRDGQILTSHRYF